MPTEPEMIKGEDAPIVRPFLPPSFVGHLDAIAPTIVYHYTDQNGLMGIVRENSIWATQIQYLNDSTEMQRIFKIIEGHANIKYDAISRSYINEYANYKIESYDDNDTPTPTMVSGDYWRQLIALATGDFVLGSIAQDVFIACFCSEGDLLSQWRGYSGGAYGYSLGFTSQGLVQMALASNFIFGSCIYNANLQNAIAQDLIDYYKECVDSGRSLDDTIAEFAKSAGICGAFFKDESFKEEREWRLVSIPASRQIAHFRAGKSMIAPYTKISIGCGSEPSIKHLFVGPCPHMRLSRASVLGLLRREGVSGRSETAQQNLPEVLASSIPFRNW